MTDADRIEFLENKLRHYRELSVRLHQQLLASRNVPETHKGRSISHADPVGNRAAANADRSKGRNRTNGL